jgi:hypothetical protein
MPNARRIDAALINEVLSGGEEAPGLFEQLLGFRTSTGVIKSVHIMNDLAQTVLGGAPEHGGDFLLRVIREGVEGEDNSEEALRADPRFGEAFTRAFPVALGPARVRALRAAAARVLNFDGGAYKPSTQMASALATHKALLGFEGFRRLGLGPYLAATLEAEGRQRLVSLFEDARDPLSRAFRPLLLEAPLVEKGRRPGPTAVTPFDKALGRRLSTLLAQPLSKPTLLRYFALGASLGLVLKVLGAGREEGRPMLLALAAEYDGGSRPLRAEAVQAFRRGVDALDGRLVALLPSHPRAAALLSSSPGPKAAAVEVRGGLPLEKIAEELVEVMRQRPSGEETTYWPDKFAVALGRKAGCVLPLKDQAGWGTHLALTPELVEVLIMMSVPHGAHAEPWAKLWKRLREELGIIIGASPSSDAEALRRAGVLSVSLERLAENSELLLRQAVRRGVARRLPDSGAEAGGNLS